MTRQEVIDSYDIDPTTGIIRSPGKFEAEMCYVPALWDIVLEGFGEELYDDYNSCRITVDPIEDVELYIHFPELLNTSGIFVLRESDDGFVFCVEEEH
jgi:hypothetical protein